MNSIPEDLILEFARHAFGPGIKCFLQPSSHGPIFVWHKGQRLAIEEGFAAEKL